MPSGPHGDVTSDDFLRSEGKFAFTHTRCNENTIQDSVPGYAGDVVELELPDGQVVRVIANPTDTAASLLKTVGFPTKDGDKFTLRAADGLPTYLVKPEAKRRLIIQRM